MGLFKAVFVAVLAVGLVFGSVPILDFAKADSEMIVVPDDYSTIQEALNNAEDGATVFVKAGTYYEALVIETSVSLVGEDAASTVIDGSKGSVTDVVQVEADNVTVSGFTIRNSGGVKYYEKAGVYIEFSSGANISGNIILDNYGHGVHLVGSSNSFVASNNITGNFLCGIKMESSADNNLVQDNFFENNFEGVSVDRSNYERVQDNILNGCGIVVEYSSDTVLSGNVVSDSQSFGAHVYSSVSVVVWGNVFSDHSKGIFVSNSETTRIFGNNITSNEHGVDFKSVSDTLMFENVVSGNKIGVLLTSGDSENNTVWCNDFVDNSQQVLVDASGANVFWNTGTKGNYWSDYQGTDSNSDGVGDTAYVIDENNQDNYPIMVLIIVPEFSLWHVVLLFVLVSVAAVLLRAPVKQQKISVVSAHD